jgi:hypothetical protein
MALRCEIRILWRAAQRILRNTGAEFPFALAEERHAHAQGSEIDARNYAQQLRSWPADTRDFVMNES